MSAQERETANVGAGLWKGLGMWAWILFRISGLVLAVYLILAGVGGLTSFFLPSPLMPVLALAAGILILMGR